MTAPHQSAPTLLFDFDGTLGRSLHHWSEAFREAFIEVGISMTSHEAIQGCFHMSREELIEAHNLDNLPTLRARIRELAKKRMPLVEAYPDVHQTLQSLYKQSIILAVVTNSSRAHVEPVLRRWGVQKYFRAIISLDDVTKGKPSPEPIHTALNLISTDITNAWMIGDSVVDIEAGHAAGVKTIAFSPPENHQFVSPKKLHATKPTALIASYNELNVVLPSLKTA